MTKKLYLFDKISLCFGVKGVHIWHNTTSYSGIISEHIYLLPLVHHLDERTELTTEKCVWNHKLFTFSQQNESIAYIQLLLFIIGQSEKLVRGKYITCIFIENTICPYHVLEGVKTISGVSFYVKPQTL